MKEKWFEYCSFADFSKTGLVLQLHDVFYNLVHAKITSWKCRLYSLFLRQSSVAVGFISKNKYLTLGKGIRYEVYTNIFCGTL